METIFETSNIASLFLQEQTCNYETQYRLMSFCLLKEVDDQTLLFNNLTKKLIILTPDEKAALNRLPCKYNESLASFVKDWFVVPVDNDDFKLADQLYELSKLYEKSSRINNFVVLTTTDCNARCYYCYEHGVTKNNMDFKTANDVADYIIRKSEGKQLSIKWFGGEPLYNSEAIDIICNKLNSNNIPFKSRMTTNGYLFDDKLVEKAVDIWHLNNVQITLDGPENTYNRIKNYIYKDSISPFKKVTDNIEKLLSANIKIEIRMNVSDSNRDDIYNLIDFLSTRYPDKNNLFLYAANLFDLNESRTSEDNLRLNNEWIKICDYIDQHGFSSHKILSRLFALDRGCMAQNKKSVVISPKGLLGKCEHFSEGNMMFGSIYSDEINQSAIDYWHKYTLLDACKNCIAYPNCGGKSNCPNLSERCEFAEKQVKIYNIEQIITKEYYRYKSRQN